jgi:hypothetical protein
MTSRRFRRAPLVLLLTLLIAAPVLALDTFTDVPDSSPHHNDITAIAVAGITRGCNPPTNNRYCPADFVRRDQMASFLQRGLGRGAQASNATIFDFQTAPATLASTSLTVPGSGFVQVNAAVNATQVVIGGLCPTSGAYVLNVRVSDPVSTQTSHFMQESVASGSSGSASATFLFDVDVVAPTARTFNVDAFMTVSACYDVVYDLNAVWVPFGSTGGSTLGTDASIQSQPARQP